MTVQFGSEGSGPTMAAAMDVATRGMDRIRAALIAAAVAGGDLQSTEMSAWPRHDDRSKIVAYDARFGLSATLRDLAGAGDAIATAVAAGADAARLHGMSFAISDPDQLAREAREAAWADALDKAEQYAGLSGRSLGRVVSVAEVPANGWSPVRFARAEAAAVPVEGGTNRVTVTVEVRWELA
jgi:uncharacterized protein YggE